jgi:TonB family protein
MKRILLFIFIFAISFVFINKTDASKGKSVVVNSKSTIKVVKKKSIVQTIIKKFPSNSLMLDQYNDYKLITELNEPGFHFIPISDKEYIEIYNEDDESIGSLPKYPDGIDNLLKFLDKNLVYPEACQNSGESGKMIVEFEVDTDGYVIKKSITVYPSSKHPEFKKEILRVSKLMPKWIPAKNYKGEPICVKYRIPVTFKLK